MRRIRLALGALLLASPFMVLATPSAGSAQTSPSSIAPTPQEQAAAIAEPSIVYLSIDLKYFVDTGQTGAGYIGPYEMKGSCTGFHVSSDGYVVTAGHCADLAPGSTLWNAAIKNALQSEVTAGTITADEANGYMNQALGLWKVEGQAAGSPAQLTITVTTPLGVSGQQAGAGKTARVAEAKSFEDGDVALLKVEETNAPILELGSDSDVSIGTAVLAAGYPGAETGLVDPTLSPTFKDGQINAKTTREGMRVPTYEMSASLSPGMSGGPTISLDGKLVGVNSFLSNANQNFNFISPVSLVKELLARNSVKTDLGPVDIAYREGLNAYFSGDYQGAIASFDKVLGVAPGHYYAQQFKQKANEKLASAPPTTVAPSKASSSSSGAIWIVLAVVAILIVLVVIVLIVVMKGRGNKGAPGPQTPVAPGYGAAPPPGAAPGAVPPQPGAPMASSPTAATAPVPTVPPPTAAPTAPPTAAPGAAPAGGSVAFCGSCGRQVGADERFCPGCGHDLQS